MATANRVDARPASSVDYLVDENASRIEVEDNSQVTLADDFEDTVGATGPSNWWMTGLVALGIVAAILLGLQLLGGGTPGTDVQPGTPVAQPSVSAPLN